MKFIRCRQGHVFDIDAADACPICGEVFVTRRDTAENETSPPPQPVPDPPPVAGRWRVAAVAATLSVAVAGGGSWYFYKPDPCKDPRTAGSACMKDVAVASKDPAAGRRDSATKPTAPDLGAIASRKAPTPDEALQTAKAPPTSKPPASAVAEPSRAPANSADGKAVAPSTPDRPAPVTAPLAKIEPPKTEPAKTESQKAEPPKAASPVPAPEKSDAPKQQARLPDPPAKPKAAPETAPGPASVAPPVPTPPLDAKRSALPADKPTPGSPAEKAPTPSAVTPKREAKLEDQELDLFGPMIRKRNAIRDLKLSPTLIDQLEIEEFKQSKFRGTLESVSQHGFADATYRMAIDDLEAKDDLARRLRGFKELKKAAAQGHAVAAVTLADAYCAGNLIPKDVSKARAYALAAARDNVFIRTVLACTGLSRSAIGTTASDALDLAFKGDPRTLQVATPMVEVGVGGAMLAKAFYDIAHEPGGTRKLEAFRLGERALRRGTSDAFALMAVTNGDGNVLPKNDAEALVWYKLAQVYTRSDSERKFLTNVVQRRLKTIDPKVFAKIRIVAPFIDAEPTSSSSKPPN